jgi:hypothetical protein
MATPYVIAGCPFMVGPAYVPCVTGQWVVAATRVMSNGQPLVLMNSVAVCAPNGTPLTPVAAQTRVIGS